MRQRRNAEELAKQDELARVWLAKVYEKEALEKISEAEVERVTELREMMKMMGDPKRRPRFGHLLD